MPPNSSTEPGEDTDNHGEVFGYFRDGKDDVSSEQESPFGVGKFLRKWWIESLWPGMGLFGESYLLFSIGTLTPLWKELYPDCWATNDNGQDATTSSENENDYYAYESDDSEIDSCSPRLLESLTYGVVLGVIAGMVLLGYCSNFIGRRNGSILTASLMAGGSLGLVGLSAYGATIVSAKFIFTGTVGCLILFGIGVGGEYPLSASLASEKATEEIAKNQELLAERKRNHKREAKSSFAIDKEVPDDPGDNHYQQSHRGRRVQLVFAMQGMGIWFNSLTMLVLLWALTGKSSEDNNNKNNDGKFEYDNQALLTVWRVTYGIGSLVLCFVLLTRVLYLEESKVWLNANKANTSSGNPDHHQKNEISSTIPNGKPADRTDTTPETNHKFWLVHKQYGSRMFGAGMAWLLWDISFYGNKLFQSTFLLALVGDNATLTELTGAAALNSTMALLGYFGAALLIDLPPSKWWIGGRKNLQSIGLVGTGGLFIACGWLTSSAASTGTITVALYLASSLVGQLGPNCTTFLIPAEIVPTDQRTYCHGVCAASGKVGALIAAVFFHCVVGDDGSSSASLFYLCGAAGILGALVTHVFVPETAGLDLLELDLHWNLLLAGTEEKGSYNGPAVHSDHLSLYERHLIRRTKRQAGVADGDNEPTGGYFS